MSTYHDRTMQRARHAFWDNWDSDEEELKAIERDVLALLCSLENRRGSVYSADEVKQIDDLAADISGMTYDFLRKRVAAAKSQADEVGIDPYQVDLETSVLCEEADKHWERSGKTHRRERPSDFE